MGYDFLYIAVRKKVERIREIMKLNSGNPVLSLTNPVCKLVNVVNVRISAGDLVHLSQLVKGNADG